jgi:hypothetical protein
LLYSAIVPLRSDLHRNWKAARTDRLSWVAGQNVLPLTTGEFSQAQRHYPIVFSLDKDPVPLALMGLTPGTNAFVEADGRPNPDAYLPAYARRYPFILARRQPDAAELSLCFDPASDLVGSFDEGEALFDNGVPSATCRDILAFCQKFEESGEQTRRFVAELLRHDLLVDGQVDIQTKGAAGSTFGGFRIVDNARLAKLRGHVHRQWAENGILRLIYAHLFSLELMAKVATRAPATATEPAQELLLQEEAVA